MHAFIIFVVFSFALRASSCNTWAVVVSTSRLWLNYRHASSALLIYNALKDGGVPDSQIILMLADVPACNSRNPAPGSVFADEDSSRDLFGCFVSCALAHSQSVRMWTTATQRYPPQPPHTRCTHYTPTFAPACAFLDTQTQRPQTSPPTSPPLHECSYPFAFPRTHTNVPEHAHQY